MTRYLDLFTRSTSVVYNTLFKITYLVSSLYILFLMMRVFPRSRESEAQWRLSGYILLFSTVCAPVFHAVFRDRSYSWSVLDLLRNFSWILESLAVLPQLTLLAHTAVPTVINSYYLLALGSYRALYILNWIVRGANHDYAETSAVIWGVVQTALYVEFLWIYVNRQKVKLRSAGDGLLDGDEFARGLVLGRIIGRADPKHAAGAAAGRRTGGGWRGEGLSVSADDFAVGTGDDDEDDDDHDRDPSGLHERDADADDPLESEDEDEGLERESDDVERGLIRG